MTTQPSRIALPAMLLACALPISLHAQPAPPAGPAAPPQATSGPTAPAAPAAPVLPTAAAPTAPAPAPIAPAPAAAAPAPGGAATQVQPPAPAPAWLPRQTAILQIVEKVDATHRTLDVPVGGTAKIDTLAIAVKACLVRPPDQERDAAAYLDITGKDQTAPAFQGWMLAAEPAVSLFKDPLYDVRVSGCR